MAMRFKDWRLQAALMFQDLYVGLSPTQAPAVFSLLPATELIDGVHYPIGGFGKVCQVATMEMVFPVVYQRSFLS